MSFAQVNVSDAQLAAAGIGERLPAFTDRTGWFDWAAELLPSFSRRAVELEEQIRSAPLGSDLSLGMLRSKQWLETKIGRASCRERVEVSEVGVRSSNKG